VSLACNCACNIPIAYRYRVHPHISIRERVTARERERGRDGENYFCIHVRAIVGVELHADSLSKTSVRVSKFFTKRQYLEALFLSCQRHLDHRSWPILP